MSENILFLGNKIFEIPPFFQTRPGDLGEKVHACSLRFSALNVRPRRPRRNPPQICSLAQKGLFFSLDNLIFLIKCYSPIFYEPLFIKIVAP